MIKRIIKSSYPVVDPPGWLRPQGQVWFDFLDIFFFMGVGEMGKIERMGISGKKGNGGGVVGGRKQEGKREKMRKKKKGGGQRERELGGASLGEKTGCWEAFTSSR